MPASWKEPWIHYLTPEFLWNKQYDTFKEGGGDMLLIVSPGELQLLVADADCLSQMTTRRNDFPKPTERYESVDIFGKNVVSTEGAYWRHHRKITSPPFTEKNNYLVWQESLHQAQSMMAGWMGKNPENSGPLKTIASEAMRLSLHVISRAGFGVRLGWPHEETDEELPEGHTLSYKDALSGLLENIIVVMLTPSLMLKYSPLKIHKHAQEAFVEWGKYMREMYHAKRVEVKAGQTREGMDLMGALVKGAGLTTESLNSDGKADPEKADPKKQLLTDEEILGNAFVFILAGHETAANTIHFSILFLAMRWSSQKRLQDDLDAILGDKPTSEWDYDTDMPKLFGSMCGAVMNEQLRLIPPVVGIPKCTRSPQGLQFNGEHVTVPGNTYISLHTVATHRNPKYWPHTSEEDLLDFRPERWLLDPQKTNTNTEADTYEKEEGLDFDGPDKRPDTAASLYRPARGAYLPFSEGYRSCLGRRFAQVEILAVLAVIFKHYSVELDLGEWMSDEEIERATEEEVKATWDKADARARWLLKEGMMTIITIQMRKDKVPMRFVRRGRERFKFN